MSGSSNVSMIKRTVDDGICTLTFDRPESGANIFDVATMRELAGHLDVIEKESKLRGLIVTSAKKSIFIAGADLKTLLRQAQTGALRAFIAEGQRVFNRIAALKIPTGAAINGACAGGGYEITLACDWRVASSEPATKIGLPETTLGLVPAWGGTTRLPLLIGAEKAAEVILKGKLFRAEEALQLGLVDEVVSREQLLEAARKQLAKGKRPMEGRAPASPASPEFRPPKSSANAAPGRAFEIIQNQAPTEESLQMELDAIVELGETEATQNLIRNFFLADKYRKGKADSEKIVHAAVIGAGVMGSGIAQWLSSRGVTVILRDVSRDLVDRGLANIEKVYGEAVKRGILSDEKAKEGRARIICSTAHVEMRDVKFVIEAASEKIEIKKEIFHELAAAAPKAVLASNTSALSISELGEESGWPERVVGLHFFNPVSRMKLIEVVVGQKTSDETRDRALGFARQIGKLPVLVRDRPGFLVNRVLFPYLLEAAELFEAGVETEAIDRALLQWGMPMGPLRLIDEIGVDITVDIARTLEKSYGRRDQATAVLLAMREQKMLGRKSGTGFYRYEGRTPTPNESAQAMVGAPRTTSAATGDDLTNRLVLLMVNEAARCLEEKVVDSPEDADYGMYLGTGFPAHRGGPLRFAENFGLKRVVDELERFAQTSEKFTPCDLLRNHAKDGTKFYEP